MTTEPGREVVPLRRPARPATPRTRGARPEPLWREVVGDQLRSERLARRERLTDVARRAGVSPQYLSELERGRKDPSSEMLASVAGSLGLTVLDLTRRAGTRLAAQTSHAGPHPGGPVLLAA